MLHKYGHYLVGTQYEPHITLCRIDDDKGDIMDLLSVAQEKWDLLKFPILGLRLYEAGSGGTCLNELATFSFKST